MCLGLMCSAAVCVCVCLLCDISPPTRQDKFLYYDLGPAGGFDGGYVLYPNHFQMSL